ncbi:hypothetical protein ACIBLA_12090 [Streptomyces sp. NPDC050433]|uniref:hypothetical protein n=1 Tax=unclassified Streptomyces TaxID=2593676 RepID=UPI0034382B91
MPRRYVLERSRSQAPVSGRRTRSVSDDDARRTRQRRRLLDGWLAAPDRTERVRRPLTGQRLPADLERTGP